MWNMTAHGSLHLARKAEQALHSISVGAKRTSARCPAPLND